MSSATFAARGRPVSQKRAGAGFAPQRKPPVEPTSGQPVEDDSVLSRTYIVKQEFAALQELVRRGGNPDRTAVFNACQAALVFEGAMDDFLGSNDSGVYSAQSAAVKANLNVQAAAAAKLAASLLAADSTFDDLQGSCRTYMLHVVAHIVEAAARPAPGPAAGPSPAARIRRGHTALALWRQCAAAPHFSTVAPASVALLQPYLQTWAGGDSLAMLDVPAAVAALRAFCGTAVHRGRSSASSVTRVQAVFLWSDCLAAVTMGRNPAHHLLPLLGLPFADEALVRSLVHHGEAAAVTRALLAMIPYASSPLPLQRTRFCDNVTFLIGAIASSATPSACVDPRLVDAAIAVLPCELSLLEAPAASSFACKWLRILWDAKRGAASMEVLSCWLALDVPVPVLELQLPLSEFVSGAVSAGVAAGAGEYSEVAALLEHLLLLHPHSSQATSLLGTLVAAALDAGGMSWLLPRLTAAEASGGGDTLLGRDSSQCLLWEMARMEMERELAPSAVHAASGSSSPASVLQQRPPPPPPPPIVAQDSTAALDRYLQDCPETALFQLLRIAAESNPHAPPLGGVAVSLLLRCSQRGVEVPAQLLTQLLEAATQQTGLAGSSALVLPGKPGPTPQGTFLGDASSGLAAVTDPIDSHGAQPKATRPPGPSLQLLLICLRRSDWAAIVEPLPQTALVSLLSECTAAGLGEQAAAVLAFVHDLSSAMRLSIAALPAPAQPLDRAAAATAATVCRLAAGCACDALDSPLLLVALDAAEEQGVLHHIHATLRTPLTLLETAMGLLLAATPSASSGSISSGGQVSGAAAGSQVHPRPGVGLPGSLSAQADTAALALLRSCSNDGGVLPAPQAWQALSQPTLQCLSRALRDAQQLQASATVASRLTSAAARRLELHALSKAIQNAPTAEAGTTTTSTFPNMPATTVATAAATAAAVADAAAPAAAAVAAAATAGTVAAKAQAAAVAADEVAASAVRAATGAAEAADKSVAAAAASAAMAAAAVTMAEAAAVAAHGAAAASGVPAGTAVDATASMAQAFSAAAVANAHTNAASSAAAVSHAAATAAAARSAAADAHATRSAAIATAKAATMAQQAAATAAAAADAARTDTAALSAAAAGATLRSLRALDAELAVQVAFPAVAALVLSHGGGADLALAATTAAQHMGILPHALALLTDPELAALAAALAGSGSCTEAVHCAELLPLQRAAVAWRSIAAAVPDLPPSRRASEGALLLLRAYTATADEQHLWGAAAVLDCDAGGQAGTPAAHAVGHAMLVRSSGDSVPIDDLAVCPLSQPTLQGLCLALRVTGQLAAAAAVVSRLTSAASQSTQLRRLLKAVEAVPTQGRPATDLAAADAQLASVLTLAAVAAHVSHHQGGADLLGSALAACVQHDTLPQGLGHLTTADAQACATVLVRADCCNDASGLLSQLQPAVAQAAWRSGAVAVQSLAPISRAEQGVSFLLAAHGVVGGEDLLMQAAAALDPAADGPTGAAPAAAVGHAVLHHCATGVGALLARPHSQHALEGLSLALRVVGHLHASTAAAAALTDPDACGRQLRCLVEALASVPALQPAPPGVDTDLADTADQRDGCSVVHAALATAAWDMASDAQLATLAVFAKVQLHVRAQQRDTDLVMKAVAAAVQHGTLDDVLALLDPEEAAACAVALVGDGRSDDAVCWVGILPPHLANTASLAAANAALALPPAAVTLAGVELLRGAHAVHGSRGLQWAAAAALLQLDQAPGAAGMLSQLLATRPTKPSDAEVAAHLVEFSCFFERLGVPLSALGECRPAVVTVLGDLLHQSGGGKQTWSEGLPATALHLAFDVCREEGWNHEAAQLWLQRRPAMRTMLGENTMLHQLLVAAATAGYWETGDGPVEWQLPKVVMDGSQRLPAGAQALYAHVLASSGAEAVLRALYKLGTPAASGLADQLKHAVVEALLAGASLSGDATAAQWAAQLYAHMMDTTNAAGSISGQASSILAPPITPPSALLPSRPPSKGGASHSSTSRPALAAAAPSAAAAKRKVPAAWLAVASAAPTALPSARLSTLTTMLSACKTSTDLLRLSGARLALDLRRLGAPHPGDSQPQAVAEQLVEWYQEQGMRGAAAAAMLMLPLCGLDVSPLVAFVFADDDEGSVVDLAGCALYGPAWKELLTGGGVAPSADKVALRRCRAAVDAAELTWLESGQGADGSRSRTNSSGAPCLGLNQLIEQQLRKGLC